MFKFSYSFKIGDTIEINDVTGHYVIHNISPIDKYWVDLILIRNGVRHHLRRRVCQIKSIDPDSLKNGSSKVLDFNSLKW